MRRIGCVVALLVGVMAMPAFADEKPPKDDKPCDDCRPKTKETCFNLVCYYKPKDKKYDDGKDEHEPFKSCKVAAKFNKLVTVDGGEVQDDSTSENNPAFQVTCDGVTVFNNSARRFTDLLGTRIQGEAGPHPAISLPRGALHAGSGGDSGDHVSPSVLEIEVGGGFVRVPGSCFIWTGAP